MKAFTYIHIKTQGFPFTRCITFANNIINLFIKSNKDQNTSNNIRFIVFQAMHNIYIGYHQSYLIMCITSQDSLTSLKSKMRLRSFQGFAFTRGLFAYKHKQPKYEIIRKNSKNGKKYEIWTSIKLNAQNSKFRHALPMVASRLDED